MSRTEKRLPCLPEHFFFPADIWEDLEDKVGLPLCGGSIAFLDLEGYTGRQDQQLSREKDSGQKGNARRIWTLIQSQRERNTFHLTFTISQR